jgi:hypothetical protein
MGAKPGKDAPVEGSAEMTLEELEEFLEADRLGVSANPEFKERLRERLWELLQERLRRARGDRS